MAAELFNDYYSYLLTSSPLQPISVFAYFLMSLFRIGPIIAFAPFLGSKLPPAAKMGLAISLAAIMLPTIIATSKTPLFFNVHFVGYSLKELVIGFIFAYFITIPFYVAQSSGTLIDFLRGSSSLMVPDPMTKAQISPIGLLYNYMLIITFYYFAGPFIFFDGLRESFSLLPIDGFVNPNFFAKGYPFWTFAMGLLNKILALAIQFAAPALVGVLMAEVFLGIANRLAPQVQIAFLGMSIKSILAIGLLFIGWSFILKTMGAYALDWLLKYKEILYMLK